MIGYDLSRAGFSRLFKRNALLRPRRIDHSRLTVFKIAERVLHHIADAINHFNGKRADAVQRDFHGIIGDEFRLRCHNGSPRRGLRHFVLGALSVVIVFNIGNDERLHKFFYKG